jgi:large subunit ribosomal protein L17
MLRNMAASLFKTDGGKEDPDNPGRIITTPEKAKYCRRFVERLITLGKKGGLANLRRIISLLGDKEAGLKLFNEIAPRYAARQGGYTRILRLADVRLGDAAQQCIFELVEEEIEKKPRRKKSAPKAAKKPAAKKEEAPEAAEAEEEASAEAVEAEEAAEESEDK